MNIRGKEKKKRKIDVANASFPAMPSRAQDPLVFFSLHEEESIPRLVHSPFHLNEPPSFSITTSSNQSGSSQVC
ncbi:hypothetical protein VTJ04DRAFT_3324 [Mycothermus thermophilus]|uniref:uncharacterized protein n=1 Tax=Humicola insolens TaxID=85995 RepID=UPI00374223FE